MVLRLVHCACFLKLCSQVWTTAEVGKQLSDLVDKSEIQTLLSQCKVPTTGTEAVGFFAMVSL